MQTDKWAFRAPSGDIWNKDGLSLTSDKKEREREGGMGLWRGTLREGFVNRNYCVARALRFHRRWSLSASSQCLL